MFESAGRYCSNCGSSSQELAQSIRAQIYTLPPATRLLPGHGEETSVGEEARENPYV